MKLTRIKINGLTAPAGYDYAPLVLSWVVEEAKGKKQSSAQIVVTQSNKPETILLELTEEIDATGTLLDIPLSPRTSYQVTISVTDETGDSGIGSITFETGKMAEPWKAEWIGTPKGYEGHPVLSKNISLTKKIVNAKLYMTGLGLYEASINGQPVTDEVLMPFLNNYDYHIQTQTFDVTHLLKEENCFEILLGNGWYKGRYGLDGKSENFGDQFAAIAELHVIYADGGQEVFITDESWTYQASTILSSGIYDGEVIDETYWDNQKNNVKPVVIVDLNKNLLKDRISPGLRRHEILTVQEVIETPVGETVLDFGQNFAGWIVFENHLPKGTRVHFEFGEILQDGHFFNDNYNSAKGGFIYISDGQTKHIRPHFTYFGFRYVRVTGWPKDIEFTQLYGQAIYSDLERTGFIETGHIGLNRLYQNTLWSQRSNFIDMPTDCPQRSERLGWTGDAQVYAATASYHMDTRSFYRKFLIDMRYEQDILGGSVPNYMPAMGSGGGAAVWGDAATIIPMTILEMYNSRADLSRHYDLMRDWVNWNIAELRNHYNAEVGILDFGFQFGDWLGLDGATPTSFEGGTDNSYIASVYFWHSLNLLVKAAKILGNIDDVNRYQDLADRQRQVILSEYFTPNGRLSINTQAALVIALKFDLSIKRERLVKQFVDRLQKDLYKIKGGFVGAPLLVQTLAGIDRYDLAFDFLLNEDFPSWLYAVNLGATTIWERWNSVLEDGHMSVGGMNSLNHYSYGAVIEFVYQSVVGIKALDPGFTKVLFNPHVDARLGFAKGRYESVAGTYISEWEVLPDGKLHIHLEVPFNASAIVALPFSDTETFGVTSGSYDYIYEPTKDLLTKYDEHTRLVKIKQDKEVFTALTSAIPRLGGFLEFADEEHSNKSLEELSKIFYTGITKENVATAKKILSGFKHGSSF